MGWSQLAKELADGAERARLAGDDVAMITLVTKAAECAQIARLLEPPTPMKPEDPAP